MNHANDWTHADVFNLLIILNSILTAARWNECTEQAGVAAVSCCVPPCQQTAVLSETVKTLHFDTTSTGNSEQFCDLC
jgi:hypothetical protein